MLPVHHSPTLSQTPVPVIPVDLNVSIISEDSRVLLRKITAQYRMYPPVTNQDFVTKKENCSICQEGEKENPLNSTFCGKHWYHKTCASGWITEKLKTLFADKVNYEELLVRRLNEISFCLLQIPKENCPSCPNCREYPSAVAIRATIIDSSDVAIPIYCEIVTLSPRVTGQIFPRVLLLSGLSTASSERMPSRPSNATGFRGIVPLSKIPFEKFYAAYNLAQAGMNYLQKYPKLAATIFKIQKVLVVVDLIELGYTLYFLYNNIKQKMQQVSVKKAAILSTLSLVALAALSYGAVLRIQAYSKPAFAPGEILGHLGLSAEKLKEIKLSWNAPTIQTVMQCLYVSRIVTSLGSVCFSKNPKLSVVSTVSQLFSLFRISQLQWLTLEQTLQGPFPEYISLLSRSEMRLESFTTKVICMMHSSCTKEAPHLQSVVESVYKYINTLFDKKSLKPFWQVFSQNGCEVGRSLYYKVVLLDDPLDPCACTLPIELVKRTMKAIDAYHGEAGIDIWHLVKKSNTIQKIW